MDFPRLALVILTIVTGLTTALRPLSAHPHVWVTVETTVLYESGKITGLRHKWTFDDMYTAMAIEGLDTNKDGTYSREELAELAKVNIDGLKEFDYFTHIKLGDRALKTKEPVDYYLVYNDSQLSLYFTLPLEEAVLAEAEGFSFSVYDESFFIAFDFVKDDPIKLSAAPSGCSATVGVPQSDLEDLKALNEALAGAATAGDANMGQGIGYAQTVTLGCGKS